MMSNYFDLYFLFGNVAGTKENTNQTSLELFWPEIHFNLVSIQFTLLLFFFYTVYLMIILMLLHYKKKAESKDSTTNVVTNTTTDIMDIASLGTPKYYKGII